MPRYSFYTHLFLLHAVPPAFSMNHKAARPLPHLFLFPSLRHFQYPYYPVILLLAEQRVGNSSTHELFPQPSLTPLQLCLLAAFCTFSNRSLLQCFCSLFFRCIVKQVHSDLFAVSNISTIRIWAKNEMKIFHSFAVPKKSNRNQSLPHISSRIIA